MRDVSTSGPAPSVEQARLLVEQAVQALEQTRDRPVAEHVAVLTSVHSSLQDALAALDEV
jgi:hypothetical protein